MRPTTRPTSVRDCLPQPAQAINITKLHNIPTKPGGYALVHSVLLDRSPDQHRQTATVRFLDPSHHLAGSTVWYRGRGGGWAVHWSVFLPTSVARAELLHPCTPRGALGEVTPRTPCRVGPLFHSGRLLDLKIPPRVTETSVNGSRVPTPDKSNRHPQLSPGVSPMTSSETEAGRAVSCGPPPAPPRFETAAPSRHRPPI